MVWIANNLSLNVWIESDDAKRFTFLYNNSGWALKLQITVTITLRQFYSIYLNLHLIYLLCRCCYCWIIYAIKFCQIWIWICTFLERTTLGEEEEETITGRLHLNQDSRDKELAYRVQPSFQTWSKYKLWISNLFQRNFVFDIHTLQTVTRVHINKQIIPCWLVLFFLLTTLWLTDWNILSFLPLQPINLILAMSFMTWL